MRPSPQSWTGLHTCRREVLYNVKYYFFRFARAFGHECLENQIFHGFSRLGLSYGGAVAGLVIFDLES